MVILAGTGRDTRNEAHQDAIVDLLSQATTLTSAQLTQFRNDLEALEHDEALTPFEVRALADARLGEARMLDVEFVRQKAATEQGVWAAGRILHRRGMVTTYATNAHRAGKGEGTYALVGDGVSKEELQASAYDCEVPVLDELSEWVTANIKQFDTTLHIGLSGSMGPCLGCQGRIARFIRDINAVARNVNVRLPMVVEVKYTTALQLPGAKHLPRQTQYGYTAAHQFDIPNSPVGRYWSKTFIVTVGEADNPIVTERP
jgi:hypothetical protein